MAPWLELALNHLWQSTLFALAAAGLATAFRRKPAWVRYSVWLAASVKFLVPLSALGWLGAAIGWGRPPLIEPSRALLAAGFVTAPFSLPEYTAFPLPRESPATGAWDIDRIAIAVALSVWLAGAIVVLVRWVRRWRTLRAVCREGVRLESGREASILRALERSRGIDRPIVLVATTAALEPGLFGFVRPVLLWPRVMSDVLDDAQVEAIFAHELSHASRRDNQTAALHMATEALFWFHPATWLIGSRLLQERERACDEDVLRRGGKPEVYAESILQTCKLCLTTALECASGVSGADLRNRIERIMGPSHIHALGAVGAFALLALAVAAITVPVAAGGLVLRGLGYGGNRYLQSPRQTMAFAPRAYVNPASADSARFTRATIRPATSPRGWGDIRPWAGGRLTATSVTLRDLIRFAYAPDSPLLDAELVNEPTWASTDRFDVVALADRAFTNDQHGKPSELTGMVRHLLADRFHLLIQAETRELPLFQLVRAAGTSDAQKGLRPSSSPCWRPALGVPPTSPRLLTLCRTILERGHLSAQAVPLSWLADTIGGLTRHIVRDATGLGGRYDVDLEWTPGGAISRPLRQTLGLELVPTEGPVEVLVIQDARRPITD